METKERIFDLARILGFDELDNRSFEVVSTFSESMKPTQKESEIRKQFLSFELQLLDTGLIDDIEHPVKDTTVAEHMRRDILTILSSETVAFFSHRVLRSMITGAPVVDDEGRLIGVVSATDLAGIISREETWPMIGELTVGDIMTTYTITARPTESVREVLRKMLSFRLHRIIIVDENEKPVGLMSSMDATKLLQRLLKKRDELLETSKS